MRICLVSMPWAPWNTPQLSLATLAAYVQQHEPSYQIESRYESLSLWEKMPQLYDYISDMRRLGELIYLGHLYPDRKEIIKQQLFNTPQMYHLWNGQDQEKRITPELFDIFDSITGKHLTDLAEEIAQNPYDVIGCSISFDQLFSSLALCKTLKEKSHRASIVFGGAIASALAGFILQEFPFVDYLIPGEGEKVFLDFLQRIEKRERHFNSKSGILSSDNFADGGCSTRNQSPEHIPDLDSLPIPAFQSFIEQAERLGIDWKIPIEGSRGCWWDRKEKTHNPFDACYFCDFAAGATYHEKSSEQIAREMKHQSESFQRVEFLFTDIVLRKSNVTGFTQEIQKLNKQLIFFIEGRANAAPPDLVALKNAGCYRICLGIEGFSDSYLKRINKGTLVIQNLLALKTCYEIGINADCPIIYGVPGTTPEEIAQTISNISKYAVSYSADILLIPFSLAMESTYCTQADNFKIGEIALRKEFRHSLPPDLAKSMSPYWAEYRDYNPPLDFSGWFEAVKKWQDLHSRLMNEPLIKSSFFRKPLYYFDEGSFVVVVDQRAGFEELTLDQLNRDIYMYCMRIRSRSEILDRFGALVSKTQIEEEILPSFLEKNIMFSSNNRFLSLAAAYRTDIAEKRILQDFAPNSRE